MSRTNSFITRYLVECVLLCTITEMAYGLQERDGNVGRAPDSVLTRPGVEAMDVKETWKEPLNLPMESTACHCQTSNTQLEQVKQNASSIW